MRPSALSPVPVPRQDWPSRKPPELGSWTPTMSVTVVLPAKDCQDELDRTLAALSEQSYPDQLLDVVVVDDNSSEPLRLQAAHPANTRILRLDDGGGHGSGRARHAGAQAAEGDIIVFLDADIMATRTHVEAHARWHHTVADAVVLGWKKFVDVDGIGPADVRTATRDDSFDQLLAGRKITRHVWVEDFIDEADQLTKFADDTFIAVVGASVSTTRELYAESGGFATFGLRGIVDTEFGYRIFTAGGVIVPEPAAQSYHQGRKRNLSVRGDDIKRERSGLAANHLPISLFRPSNVGRMWAVPSVHAVVDAHEASPEQVQLSVDNILASGWTDLVVTISPSADLPKWLRDYFAADARVRLAEQPVTTGFPSPLSFIVPAGVAVESNTLQVMVDAVEQHAVGVVRATVPGEAGPTVELWATRALHRARRHDEGGLDAAARRLFGEHWLDGGEVGVRRAVVDVTKQGMLVDAGRQ